MSAGVIAASAVSQKIDVGQAPLSGLSYSDAITAAYTMTNPATASGILTKISVDLAGVQARVFSVNPGTLSIRAISDTFSTSAGFTTYAVILPIVAGDYIGVTTIGGGRYRYLTTGGGGMKYSTSVHPDAAGYSVASFLDLTGYNLQLSGAS